MSDEAIDIILNRLRSNSQLIEHMLQEDYRQRYFEALLSKRHAHSNSNVTAAFFSDPKFGASPTN